MEGDKEVVEVNIESKKKKLWKLIWKVKLTASRNMLESTYKNARRVVKKQIQQKK